MIGMCLGFFHQINQLKDSVWNWPISDGCHSSARENPVTTQPIIHFHSHQPVPFSTGPSIRKFYIKLTNRSYGLSDLTRVRERNRNGIHRFLYLKLS